MSRLTLHGRVILASLGLSLAPVLASDFITGSLVQKGEDFWVKNSEGERKIVTSALIKKSLPSLTHPEFVKQSNKRPYSYEFKGEIEGDLFKLEQVPTNVPGPVSLRGTLRFIAPTGKYEVNGQEARFGYTKILNGYEFDEVSKKSLIGRDLVIDGYYDENSVFVMQALTPAFLFNASKAPFYKDGEKLIMKDMPLNVNSQGKKPFRVTLFEGQGQGVEKGDHALIVTLSGRQGDSFGSVNGHFVAGLATVKDDLSLRGEVSNAYVTNGKDILSGNTALTNYFSHLVQGQNIYRPTYTLIIYGIDQKKLKQFRDALEASHIEFRTKKLDITGQFNCTTETVKALEKAGIKGKYIQFTNFMAGVLTTPLRLFGDNGETLNYAFGNDPSRYQPRPAFESFAKAFLDEKTREELGVKRVDYVFYPQIASKRPVGGMALGSIWKVNKYKKLYEKYEENEATKLSPAKLRPLLESILLEIQ